MPTVPKYCLHKPSGRAYIRIRGRVVYCGKHGSPESLAEYGRLIAELAACPATPPVSAPVQSRPGLLVVELADAYWQFCQGYYRKKDGTPTDWLSAIHLTLHTHLCGPYGRTPAAEFGPKKFKGIRQMLVEAGLSRVYVNKLMPIIRQCFKWGASEEMVPSTVYHGLCTVGGLRKGRTKAPETAPVLPVDNALVDATLPCLPQIVADMVRFQRLTGCRPGEVCQLRPMDVDRSCKIWQFRPASHKTEHRGRERVIYIGPKAQAVIRPYLLRDVAAYCFSPIESEAWRHENRPVHTGRGRKGTSSPGRKTKQYPSEARRLAVRLIPGPSLGLLIELPANAAVGCVLHRAAVHPSSRHLIRF